MLKPRFYRDDLAACLNFAASFTPQACVNARRAKHGDAYAARYVISYKTQVRQCLVHARENRLEAISRGFRLP